MSAPISINVIPAQAGFFVVIAFDETKELLAEEPVIAWRVETYHGKDNHEIYSVCSPLTPHGDIVSNCIGVQNPDKSITLFHDASYNTLKDAQAARYSV